MPQMLKLKVLFLKDTWVHPTHIFPSIFLFVLIFFLHGSSSSLLPNKECLGILTDVDGGCGVGGGRGGRMREEGKGMGGGWIKWWVN